jgi:hypothetical protein
MDPTGGSLVAALASHGVLGLMCAVLLWALWIKDRDLTRERAARIADAKAYTDLALNLQARVIASVEKLSDIFEAQRRGP